MGPDSEVNNTKNTHKTIIFTGMDNTRSRITESLSAFSPISLDEMDGVRLMNRTDTKYIFHIARLPELLDACSGSYRILSINGCRVFKYNSLYFDTPGLKYYLDHHNGIRPRYKIRFREYEDTGTHFLEVKKKNVRERTKKTRITVEHAEEVLSERSLSFIHTHSPLDGTELVPSLWTIFRRITLVGLNSTERITVDIDLSFRHMEEEKTVPFLTVCEVKRNLHGGTTRFMQLLKSSRIYPGSCSKYCMGSVLLKQPLKYNNFKPHMLSLNKLKENVHRYYPVAG